MSNSIFFLLFPFFLKKNDLTSFNENTIEYVPIHIFADVYKYIFKFLTTYHDIY